MLVDESRLARAEEALGHAFRDRSLLTTALTHPSYAAEHVDADTYDRMEFLGDAVVGFVVSEYLYTAYPHSPEGELTLRKHFAVAGQSLAESGERLGLADFVLMGAGAEAAGDRRRASVLENTVEAVIGALFLDAGIDAARSFIVRVLGWRLDAPHVPDIDSKGTLQQWTQAEDGSLPEYRITAVEGPVHERTFTAEVSVGGVVLGSGSGATKQAAEKAAAAVALGFLGGRSETAGDASAG